MYKRRRGEITAAAFVIMSELTCGRELALP
jgi:hypothetical protein